MRAIVLDDDAGPAMRSTLERAGFAVDVYTALAPAMARIAEHTYDVAVVDIRLPDGHGVSLIRALREAGRPTRCILISGYKEPDLTFEAGRLQVDRYMPKPFDRDHLATVAAELAGRTQVETFKDLIRHVGAPFLRPGRASATPDELLRTYFRVGGDPRISLAQFDVVVCQSRSAVAGTARCDRVAVLTALETVAKADDALSPDARTILRVIATCRLRGLGKIATNVGCSSRELREALAGTGRDVRRWSRLGFLLRATNGVVDRRLTPSQSAHAAGYSAHGQFDRDCKLEWGVTPGLIRRVVAGIPTRAGRSDL